MATGGMMFRLAFAAMVSAAAAGLLLPVLVALAGLLTGDSASWSAVWSLLFFVSIGIVGGLIFATLPAFFAGASMWALGMRFRAARLAPAWAAAGASVGAALWALFQSVAGPFAGRGAGAFEVMLLGGCLAAGAGGALAFRSVMRLTDAPEWRQ
ncbi:MAG TPA: hypothetical protein VF645_14360 [Allosphingosinicella sp.]|jgi:hypothetical protein